MIELLCVQGELPWLALMSEASKVRKLGNWMRLWYTRCNWR